MMTAPWLVLVVLSVLQAGGTPQSPQTPPAQAPTQATEVTFTGCLMPTDTSMWRPGTTGATSPGQRGVLAKPTSGYVLKNAVMVTNPSGRGDTKTKPSSGSELEYSVIPADRNVKLANHVRHEVEVRGRLVNPEQAKDPKNGLTPDRSDTAHTLTVTSVRALADTCGPA